MKTCQLCQEEIKEAVYATKSSTDPEDCDFDIYEVHSNPFTLCANNHPPRGLFYKFIGEEIFAHKTA